MQVIWGVFGEFESHLGHKSGRGFRKTFSGAPSTFVFGKQRRNPLVKRASLNANLQNSFLAACGLRFYAATGGAFGNVPANARSLLLRSSSLRPRGVGSLSVLSSSNQAESDARSNTFTATHEIAVAISWPAHPHMRRIPQFRRRVPAATSEHRPPLCS